jgi:PAS domain S-box-containing protein
MQFLPDGLIMLNHHGEIVLFNLAAEKIFQWSSEELLGKDARVLYPSPLEMLWFRLPYFSELERFKFPHGLP